MSDENAAEEAPITFHVKSSSDAKYTVTVPLSSTVAELKEKLSSSEYADLPVERQRLIYSGRVLKDADTLSLYKIKEGNTVHLVKGAASNQRQNPANQGTSTGSTPAAAAAPSMPSMAAGTGNNPLAGLTGARYAGFAQLPNQDMFGPDGGMGPPPDPEHMARMLQNPQFASMLNEALSNPQVVDMMIQQNPMLQNMGPQVRQMLQSPEFRRMMTDPEQLRSMMNMQRAMGFGPGSGSSAFPAPGNVDDNSNTQQRATSPLGGGQPQRQPFNPFAAFGAPNPSGGAAANPFAALFNNPAAFGNTPAATPPATASAGQGTPAAAPSTPAATERSEQSTQQQQQQPPFNPFGAGSMGSQFFQNPQAMQQFLAAMNPGGATAGAEQPANPFAALLQQMGGEGGFGAPQQQAPVDTRPPEDRYAEQLRQLNDMGFYEFERNVEALRRAGGSVQGAIEYLLNH